MCNKSTSPANVPSKCRLLPFASLNRLGRLATAIFVCANGAGFSRPSIADPLALPRQTCTTLNCGSLLLRGRINAHPSPPAFPAAIANSWVGQFAGVAASCLRFQVVAESRDLAMTVVAPNGTVFTNDSGGAAACRACPRVVVATAAKGFYTVAISNRNGAGLETSFTLRVGLFNAGNAPNCTGPTPGR